LLIRVITVVDPRQPSSQKSLSPEAAGDVMRWLANSTRMFTAMVTRWSPEFVLTNPARDIQSALLALKVENSGQVARDAAKNMPKALRAMWRVARNPQASDEWAKYAREFKRAGGSTGVYGFERNAAAIEKDLAREVAVLGGGRVEYGVPFTDKTFSVTSKAVRAGRAVTKFVEDANEAAEGGIRLAAYVALRKAGKSAEESARTVRNVTVDFTKKGELGPAINSLYAFFNAGTQGTRRVHEVLTSKNGKRAAAALFAAGIASDLLNSALSGDDDGDGESDYDQIPEYAKSKQWILATGKGNPPLTVPMPHGFNVLHAAGRLASETLRGVKSPTEAGTALASAALGAFNPIGGESDLVQQASPTLLDPAVQLEVNRNFAGNPIRPEPSP
jgi:hypothetical protein